jgi:hypothetical protein
VSYFSKTVLSVCLLLFFFDDIIARVEHWPLGVVLCELDGVLPVAIFIISSLLSTATLKDPSFLKLAYCCCYRSEIFRPRRNGVALICLFPVIPLELSSRFEYFISIVIKYFLRGKSQYCTNWGLIPGF